MKLCLIIYDSLFLPPILLAATLLPLIRVILCIFHAHSKKYGNVHLRSVIFSSFTSHLSSRSVHKVGSSSDGDATPRVEDSDPEDEHHDASNDTEDEEISESVTADIVEALLDAVVQDVHDGTDEVR